MKEKTGTEIAMKYWSYETRGRGAARKAGYRTESEIAAFLAGAGWLVDELRANGQLQFQPHPTVTATIKD